MAEIKTDKHYLRKCKELRFVEAANDKLEARVKELETIQNEILAELRWYGKTIAGGGPMTGFALAGRRASNHWYDTTLPLLERLGAVYATARKALDGEEKG